MEFFRSPNIDWLSKKWYFLGFSLIFSIAGIMSMMAWHGIPLGIDFRGGTDAYVKFAQAPDLDKIRADLDRIGLKSPRIQQYGDKANNEVLISLPESSRTGEADLTRGRTEIIQALEVTSPAAQAESQKPQEQRRQDLNNSGLQTVQDYLTNKDPLKNGGDPKAYGDLARRIVDLRDKSKGGVLSSIDELNSVADARVINSLKDGFFVSNFGVRNLEVVGPTVGKQLQNQAKWAILYSLLGMLVYLWFRFEWIYGVAAVVACFHDTLITIGAFSLLNKKSA